VGVWGRQLVPLFPQKAPRHVIYFGIIGYRV
jgi:hypothetical protein